jgi:ribosomal-protein-alanine N-acetyltransferase
MTTRQVTSTIKGVTAPLPRVVSSVSRFSPSLFGISISISYARIQDLPALAGLQRRAFARDRGYGLLTLLTLFFSPRAVMLVAWVEDGVPAGIVIADTRRGRTAHARILNLCVAPEYRRQGCGRLLLETVAALLIPTRIVLLVDEQNAPAIALYERAGYLTVGRKPDYYARGRHALVMQKTRAT